MNWEKIKFWKNSPNLFKYSNEKYLEWENINSTIISRKLENETCFDGIVKIYSLRTNKTEINKLLENKYFGSFIFIGNDEIFLRMFKTKNSWPNTILVKLNLESCEIEIIRKTNSSWENWKAEYLGNGDYKFELKPTEIINYKVQYNN